MITPRFHLTQDSNTVTINIRAPYCSLRELEVLIDEQVYLFICKPYYLRINLPGKLIENDNSHSKFDAELGEFTFTYDKANEGEEFPDLDLITKLLCTKIVANDGQRKIEILMQDDVDTNSIESDVKYGFALRGGYNFQGVSSEFYEIFEIDPHLIKFDERHAITHVKENQDFNEDHYLADLLDGDEIQEFLLIKPPWIDSNASHVSFNAKELDFLKDLPNVQYNLTSKQTQYAFNSLIEVLYAYLYERRTSFFEGTCESGWTISKLTATLTCFDGFDSAKAALISGFRRSLIYPLYRDFALSQIILGDLKAALKLNQIFLIKLLIQIYEIFLGSSSRYVLNNLFIKDYITFVMTWDKSLWLKTVDDVLGVEIRKDDLNLDLLRVEAEAVNYGDLTEQLSKLKLDTGVKLDSDDESSCDEVDDSSESSTEVDSDDSSSEEQ